MKTTNPKDKLAQHVVNCNECGKARYTTDMCDKGQELKAQMLRGNRG